MIWLAAITALAVGLVIGVVFASRLNTSPSRVHELENQIRSLKENHFEYKESVSDHFSMTAELVQHMTESYKEVYQHLATGAQDLCSIEVASKLLPTSTDAVFDTNSANEESSALLPPRDYAAKQNPEQKGALAEDFGLDKPKEISNEESPAQPSN